MVALEHSLIILLLLVGLLHARPALHPLAQWAMAGGVALAFVAPTLPVALPWSWLAGLAIPMLLWQAARHLVSARWPSSRSEAGLWLLLVTGIGVVLAFSSQLSLSGAFLFSMLAASMVWRATEGDGQPKPSMLGQVGPLALAFLLVEVAPAVEAPNRYPLALVGGAGLGALGAYLAVQAARRLPAGRWRDLLSISQVYLAYAVAVLIGLSGVVAALLSVAVYVAYGTQQGLWQGGRLSPRPLNSRLVFLLAVAALAFFAWQTHVPFTFLLLLEIGLCLLVTVGVIWLGKRAKTLAFTKEISNLRIYIQVVLLLLPALLLWPREALLDPAPLALALLVASLATLGTHYALTPLLNLYSWLDEAGTQLGQTGEFIQSVQVEELMSPDVATVLPLTPVAELARLLAERPDGCLLVVDPAGQVVGIVTEADLFVREERLPQTSRTYSALFKVPIVPEQLPETYAELAATRTAEDVMTQELIWVKENYSIGQAIQLMVHHGFKRLPVLTADPRDGGKLVGLITRAGIVRSLSAQ